MTTLQNKVRIVMNALFNDLEVSNGKTLPPEDKDRLIIAVNRLREAYELCH